MCSGEDHGESERRMMPAASSSEFRLRFAQLVRVEAAGLGEHWAARHLDGAADFVFRRRFAFSVADYGWEQS
jgi:hypothetical protein